MTDQQPEVVDLFVVQFRIQGTGEWKAVGITGGIEGARTMAKHPFLNLAATDYRGADATRIVRVRGTVVE